MLNGALSRAIRDAGPRYMPGLDQTFPNIEIESLVETIESLSRGEALRLRIKKYREQLSKNARLAALPSGKCKSAEELNKRIARLVGCINNVVPCIRRVEKCVETIDKRVSWVALKNGTITGKALCSDCLEQVAICNDELQGRGVRYDQDLAALREAFRNVNGTLEEILTYLGSIHARLINRPALLITSAAGMGKTHFVCDLAQRSLKAKASALIVLAKDLDTSCESVLSSVMEYAQLGANEKRLLKFLDKSARISQGRSLIIIDGLNECEPGLWKRGLRSFLMLMRQFPSVGVVLTCRTPFEDLYIPRLCRKLLISASHPGLSDNLPASLKAFFSYYRLPAPQVPLLYDEFAHPLFLRVVCMSLRETAVEKRHRRIREIASGQEGLTKLYEDFIRTKQRDVNAKLCRKFGVRKLSAIVTKEDWLWSSGLRPGFVKDIAERMVATHCRYVSYDDCRNALKSYFLSKKQLASAVRILISEGILIQSLDWSKERPVEVLEFPYQKVSDHLIVRTALAHCGRNETKIRELLRSWLKNPYLLEAVTIALPERIKNAEVFDFLERNQIRTDVVRAFLSGIRWRKANTITARTRKMLKKVLEYDTLRNEAFDALTALALRPQSDSPRALLESVLIGKSTAQRDLTWSEYLRVGRRDSPIKRTIEWILDLHKIEVASDQGKSIVEVLKWFLTSTNRLERDRCTRCLWKIGMKEPQLLFDATMNSFCINDPYVIERMVAASYGVGMHFCGGIGVNFQKINEFVVYALRLYNRMFRGGAIESPKHALTRDYARHTMYLAQHVRPGTFGTKAMARIEAPLTRASFRKWGYREDKNRDQYRDGNAPIHLDFETYVLPTILPDRYDVERHPKKRTLLKQVRFRISDLGWHLKTFGSIDSEIATFNYFNNQTNSETKVDRYGKKYSWIAYYELASKYEMERPKGGRADNYRLDIDPSFPGDPTSIKFITDNLIGRSKTDFRSWIHTTRFPKPKCLKLSRLSGVDSDFAWLNLESAVTQDSGFEKRVNLFVHAFFIRDTDLTLLKKVIQRTTFDWNQVAFSRDEHRYFAGEFPWIMTFPGADKQMMQFQIGEIEEKVRRDEMIFSNGNGQLSEQDLVELADLAQQRLQTDSKYGSFEEAFCAIIEERRLSIEVRQREHVTKSPQYKEILVESPCLRMHWEGNSTTKYKSVSVPNSDFARRFNLRILPSDWVFLDRSGKVALVTSSHGEWTSVLDEGLFAREDLVRDYLNENHYELVWFTKSEKISSFGKHDEIRAKYPGCPLLRSDARVYHYNSLLKTTEELGKLCPPVKS